jgi:hypothetical protein
MNQSKKSLAIKWKPDRPKVASADELNALARISRKDRDGAIYRAVGRLKEFLRAD